MIPTSEYYDEYIGHSNRMRIGESDYSLKESMVLEKNLKSIGLEKGAE